MPDHIASALRIARRYGQRYAEGGDIEDTEPAFDEFALQRQQAKALPDRPPVAMEPDLNAAQMREQDIPEGYAVNDAGVLFNKQTGEEISTTRRPNVLPITKTPEGRYEGAMPKVADVFGNMGGGWSAPVSGAETILGAGARVPRRMPPAAAADPIQNIADRLVASHGYDGPALARALDTMRDNGAAPHVLQDIFNRLPPEARSNVKIHDAYSDLPKSEPKKPIDIDEFFGTASPSQVEHLSDADVFSLRRQMMASGNDYYMDNPELYTALHKRLDEIDRNNVTGLNPSYVAPRNFESLDELEKAYNRVTQSPQAHPNAPVNHGERITARNFFFENQNAVSDLPRMTDTQINHLWDDVLTHSANEDGIWHNIDNYKPELLDLLRQEVRHRRAQIQRTASSPLDELRQLLGEAPPGHRVAEPQPQRQRSQREDYESYSQRRAREDQERREAFTPQYAAKLAPHFGNENEFMKAFFAGKHGPGMETWWTPSEGFVFDGHLVGEDGRSVGNITRKINPDNKTAYHSYWRVNTDKRGTGVVPSVLRNQIDTYKKLGIERVTMNANIDVGSYAWARYGWIPSADQWSSMASDMKYQLNQLNLGGNAKAAVLEILNNPNPKAIWALADAEIPASLAADAPNIGKVLLKNRSWNGTFHMKDQETMTRFDRYVKERLEKAKKGKDKDK